jgi:hypothetical protein
MARLKRATILIAAKEYASCLALPTKAFGNLLPNKKTNTETLILPVHENIQKREGAFRTNIGDCSFSLRVMSHTLPESVHSS